MRGAHELLMYYRRGPPRAARRGGARSGDGGTALARAKCPACGMLLPDGGGAGWSRGAPGEAREAAGTGGTPAGAKS